MINKLISMLTILIMIGICSQVMAASPTKITIKVIDEEGKPMEGAIIGGCFWEYSSWEGKKIAVEGITNLEGKVTFTSVSDGMFSFGLTKSEYYQGQSEFNFAAVKSNRWEPWNPEVTVVMRKVVNPVPMYAKFTDDPRPLHLPIAGEEVGFDLVVADWVFPFGKGSKGDMIFKLDRTHYKNPRDYDTTLTITFSNRFDGIFHHPENRKASASIFKLPRMAPDTGYQQKLVLRAAYVPGQGQVKDGKPTDNYFFRVRSEERDSQLLRAQYGKIQGPIEFDPRWEETASIKFLYFLNPDNTRNMEYGKNLFKGIGIGMSY